VFYQISNIKQNAQHMSNHVRDRKTNSKVCFLLLDYSFMSVVS